MINFLRITLWSVVTIVVFSATDNFYGVPIGTVAHAKTANTDLTYVGVLITDVTELEPEEILEAFAVEQKPRIVPVGVDISIPVLVEPALYYLLIRDSISGQWNYYYFSKEDWVNTLRPYLNSTDATIVEFSSGADVNNTAAQLASMALGQSEYDGTQTANVLLYGSANGVQGAPQLVPEPHVESVPLLGSTTEMDQIGTLGGNFRVSETGAATYSVPIALAAGTAGVAPELNLNYVSGQGNGIAGLGWSLSGLSSVSRCKKTLLQDEMAAPISWLHTDAYCLDGQRLVLESGNYGEAGSTYRLQLDDSTLVTLESMVGEDPTSFKAQRQDGSVAYYGLAPLNSGGISSDNDALLNRVTNDGLGKTLTWALKKTEDSVGNPIWYEYDTNTSRQLITEIKYAYGANTNVDTGYGASVTFTYTSNARPDLQSGYVGGHLFSTDKLLTAITTTNKYKSNPSSSEVEATLRTYNLAYMDENTVASDNSSRLISIQECSGTSCLNPTVFNWRTPDASIASTNVGSVTLTNDDRVMMNYQVGDVNGDGIADIVWMEGKYHLDDWDGSPDAIDPYLKYAISTGNGYQQTTFTSGINQIPYGRLDLTTRVRMNLIDYNLDGRMDVAVYDDTDEKWEVYLSTPQASGTWKLTTAPVDIGVTDPYVTFVDMDSNGTTDLVYKTSTNLNPNSRIYVRKLERNSQPANSSTAYSFGSPVPVVQEDGDATILGLISSYTADFNGDGRSDLFISENGPPADNAYHTITKVSAYVLDGDPDGASITMKHYANLIDASQLGSAERILASSLRFVDFNRDGLSDVFYQTTPWGNTFNVINNVIRINKGNGEFDYQVLNEPNLDAAAMLRAGNVNFIDWNMDGYQDLVWSHAMSVGSMFRISYIRYWNQNTGAFDGRQTFGSMQNSNQVSVTYPDINGDGVLDRALFDTRNGQSKIDLFARQSLVSTGSGSAYVLSQEQNRSANTIDRITNGLGMKTEITYETLSTSDHYSRLQIDNNLVDGEECFDGFEDGTTDHCFDIQVAVADAAGFYTKLNSDWDLPAGTQTLGKLAPVLEFSGPINVVTDVASDLPTATAVAGSVDQNAMSSISYHYAQANIQAAGSGFLGFKKLTTIDNQKGVKSTTVYRQDWPFVGVPAASNVRTSAGHLLNSSQTTWGLQGFAGSWGATADTDGTLALGSLRTINKQSVQESYDLKNNGLQPGALLSTIETSSSFDSEGNPLQIVVATKKPSGQAIKTVTTTNTYFNTSQLPLREARLKDTSVETAREGYSQTKTRQSEFTYYTSGSNRGMLNTEAVEPGTAFEVTTTHSYDGFGNLIKSKLDSSNDTRCDAITTDYDSRGRYAERVYNCNGSLIAENQGRDKSGAVTQSIAYIDSGKSVTSLRAFTASGKEHFNRTETGGFAILGMSTDVQNCPAGSSYITTSTVAGGGASQVCFDKLGREVRTLNIGFDGAWDAQDTEYDALSRVLRKSEPFDLSTGPQYWTTNVYDLHDRVVHTTSPDGSTSSISYNGLTATTTNDLGHTQVQEKNVLGQVVRVEDHLTAETTYKFDHFGNLEEMTDNGGNTTVITYDVLGRKKTMDDPDKGVWSYEYTPFGELKKQTDAKGQVSIMSYDDLGRMISRLDQKPIPNSSGMSLTGLSAWVYSNPSQGNGLLTQALDMLAGFMHIYRYDDYGRQIELDTTIGADTFNSKSTFDEFGRPFQVFDAAGDGSFQDHGVVTSYNPHGFLSSVSDANFIAGESRAVYREVLAMNPRGQVTSHRLGDSIDSSTSYYEDTGRLKTIVSSGSAGQVQDLRYQWDTVGNLKYRHEYSGTKTLEETFQYDEVNRVTQQLVAGQAPINITYDDVAGKRLGNIASKTGVGNYEYGAGNAGPHAVTKAGNVDFVYDDNGNNTSSSDGRTIEYTTFDKPSKITKDGHVTDFFYDFNRARFKRIDTNAGGVTTTRYIGNVEIIERPDGTLEKKRYLGGVVVQTIYYGDNDIEDYRSDLYTLKDHLGSIDVIVDSSGAIQQEMSFDAWGQRRNASNWQALSAAQLVTFDHNVTTRGFTGHEMLDEVGIVHMNGRIYDPRIARFLSADPIIQDPYSTQSLNRYSYLWNNPLNGTDPTGYITIRQGLSIAIGAAVTFASFGTGYALAGNMVASVGSVTHYALAGAYAGAVGGFASGLVGSGTFEGAFKSAGWGALSGAAFGAIGRHFKLHHDGSGTIKAGAELSLGTTEFTKLVLAHAVTGGVLSELQGGKFGHGFASAGISKLTTPLVLKIDRIEFQFATTMIIGGTVSEVTGGKFANGAATAAIQFAVNASSREQMRQKSGDGGAPDEMQAYKALKARVLEDARAHPTILLLLSKEDFEVILEQMSVNADILDRHPFLSEQMRYDFGHFDSFLYKEIDLIGREFLVEGYGVGVSGDVNYIAIGALSARYGYGEARMRNLIIGHNLLDIFERGKPVRQNLQQIATGYNWALEGYDYYMNQR